METTMPLPKKERALTDEELEAPLSEQRGWAEEPTENSEKPSNSHGLRHHFGVPRRSTV